VERKWAEWGFEATPATDNLNLANKTKTMKKKKKKKTHQSNPVPMLVANCDTNDHTSTTTHDDGGNSNNDADDSTAPNTLHKVKAILAHSLLSDSATMIFHVHWAGCSAADDTWEPLSNLLGCPELLSTYLAITLPLA
jgi:hypothetical protein